MMGALAIDAPLQTKAAKRPLWVLLGANAISLAGDRMTALAVPWFVLTTTGSAVQTGLVSLFTFIPVILAAFVGERSSTASARNGPALWPT